MEKNLLAKGLEKNDIESVGRCWVIFIAMVSIKGV